MMNKWIGLVYAGLALWAWLPSQVLGQSCRADCTVTVSQIEELLWTPRYFNTTIVAATVVQIVNTDLDTTRTTTVFNELPAGYTIPTNTNAEGTQTVRVAYTRSGTQFTTNVAFPTQFYQPPDRYFWNGTLPTKEAFGNSVCSVDTRASVIVDYWTQPSTWTTPTHTYGPDPGGLLFSTMWGVKSADVYESFESLYTNDAAFQSCDKARPVAPANVVLTARFITDTSVSYEGGSSSSSKGQTQPSPNSATTTTGGPSKTPPPDSETVNGDSTVVGSSTHTPSASTFQQTTSTSLQTVVTDSPSGPVTLINTVEIVSVVVISTPDGTTPTEESTGSATQSSGECKAAIQNWVLVFFCSTALVLGSLLQ